MMLTCGVDGLPQRVHRRVPALLDRLEIWDTPVTHRSRSRPPRTYQEWRDGATHYTLCLGGCDVLCFRLHQSGKQRILPTNVRFITDQKLQWSGPDMQSRPIGFSAARYSVFRRFRIAGVMATNSLIQILARTNIPSSGLSAP